MQIDGDELKKHRLKRMLTQVELAEKAGVTEQTVNRLEQERQVARISTVRRLTEALGVEPSDILKQHGEDVT